MWYKIDFKRLVPLLLPVFLRGKLLVSILQAMTAPARDVYKRFMAYRETASRRVYFTGETLYLEKILNDEFNLINEIFITDMPPARGNLFLRKKSEIHKPVYLYHAGQGEHVILVNPGEINPEGDFVINIPEEFDTSESIQKIKRIAGYYKMTGKQYKIQTYE